MKCHFLHRMTAIIIYLPFQNPKISTVIGRFRYPIPLCTSISYCHFSNTTHFTNPTYVYIYFKTNTNE